MLDTDSLTEAHLAEQGANTSFIHIDWMIGSSKIDVDAINHDGTREPLMRQGEWSNQP